MPSSAARFTVNRAILCEHKSTTNGNATCGAGCLLRIGRKMIYKPKSRRFICYDGGPLLKASSLMFVSCLDLLGVR